VPISYEQPVVAQWESALKSFDSDNQQLAINATHEKLFVDFIAATTTRFRVMCAFVSLRVLHRARATRLVVEYGASTGNVACV
jgi:hypothetical protein